MNSQSTHQTSDGSAQENGAASSGAGTLGQTLRRAREQRGMPLRQISDQTRIAMRFLEAIEADDYKRLPGGIFNKSFVKAYAKQVGFDEPRALELYERTAREHGHTPGDAATSPARSPVYMDGGAERSPLVTTLLSAFLVGILALVVYAGLHWYRRSGDAAQTADAASGTAANGQAQPQPQPAAPATRPAADTPGLQVQVRAKGEEVWLDARVDEEKQPDTTLAANQTREFTPRDRLSLRYSKSKLDALEVRINGRVAQAPPPGPKGTVEWVITRDDYKQFLP